MYTYAHIYRNLPSAKNLYMKPAINEKKEKPAMTTGICTTVVVFSSRGNICGSVLPNKNTFFFAPAPESHRAGDSAPS